MQMSTLLTPIREVVVHTSTPPLPERYAHSTQWFPPLQRPTGNYLVPGRERTLRAKVWRRRTWGPFFLLKWFAGLSCRLDQMCVVALWEEVISELYRWWRLTASPVRSIRHKVCLSLHLLGPSAFFLPVTYLLHFLSTNSRMFCRLDRSDGQSNRQSALFLPLNTNLHVLSH